eukprot:SAG11_NODE_1652_length_4509_cov_3.121088_1_plen_168_part_00
MLYKQSTFGFAVFIICTSTYLVLYLLTLNYSNYSGIDFGCHRFRFYFPLTSTGTGGRYEASGIIETVLAVEDHAHVTRSSSTGSIWILQRLTHVTDSARAARAPRIYGFWRIEILLRRIISTQRQVGSLQKARKISYKMQKSGKCKIKKFNRLVRDTAPRGSGQEID